MEKLNSSHSIANNDYVNYLEDVSRHVIIYICLFYLIIGNIGTILKILFFLQKPVRTCPCTVYVIAASVNDIITLNNIPVLRLLSSLYPSTNWIHMTINRSILSILFNTQNEELLFVPSERIKICKIRSYLHMWSTAVSIHLLLFASINRYLTSLKKIKQQTNQRLINAFCKFSEAVKISVGTCIIGALISIHHYFNFTMMSNFCIPKHFIFWATWIFDIHCLIPMVLMIIFSALTLINQRKSHYKLTGRRTFNLPTRHRIEQQLTSMIITETVVTVLTTLPYAVYVMWQVIRPEQVKTLETSAREDLIEQLVRSTMYLGPSCSFYVYLFTLTTLRKRFSRMLLDRIRLF